MPSTRAQGARFLMVNWLAFGSAAPLKADYRNDDDDDDDTLPHTTWHRAQPFKRLSATVPLGTGWNVLGSLASPPEPQSSTLKVFSSEFARRKGSSVSSPHVTSGQEPRTDGASQNVVMRPKCLNWCVVAHSEGDSQDGKHNTESRIITNV